MSHFEVEVKLLVENWEGLREDLIEKGLVSQGSATERDIYFSDGVGEFSLGKSALRVRHHSNGQIEFTVKRSSKSANGVKARREIELPLGNVSSEAATEFISALGFFPSIVVEKQREKLTGKYRNRDLTIARDTIVGVPGDYVEAEILAAEGEVAACQGVLEVWKEEHHAFGLREERRNYRGVVAHFLVTKLLSGRPLSWIGIDRGHPLIGPMEGTMLGALTGSCRILPLDEARALCASGDRNGIALSTDEVAGVPTVIIGESHEPISSFATPPFGLRALLSVLLLTQPR